MGKERCEILAEYLIEYGLTVRAVAHAFSISKSTVHKDVSQRLKTEDHALYEQVRDILDINKQERHIRGGLATRKKYREIAESKNRRGY